MCIAIVKPNGIKAPSKKILKECWNNNPDGAGYCYNDGSKVIIHKGFMSFNDFYSSYKQHDYTNCDLIIHFRIATHGGVNMECTHPFVVSKNIEDLQKLNTTCKRAFVHNGIIGGYGSYNRDNKLSDTMDYCTKIIANIPQINHELLDNLAKEHSSRFALLTKNNYTLGGNWLEDGGIYYSNSSYRPKQIQTIIPSIQSTYNYWKSYRNPKTYNCEFCGQPTTSPKTVNYYGDLFDICKDCYNDIQNKTKLYSKEDTIKIYE